MTEDNICSLREVTGRNLINDLSVYAWGGGRGWLQCE